MNPRYYLRLNGCEETGPHDALEIAEAVRCGALPLHCQARREGEHAWHTASWLCDQDGFVWREAARPAPPVQPAPLPPQPQPVYVPVPGPAQIMMQPRGSGCLPAFAGGLTGCALLSVLALAFSIFVFKSCVESLSRSAKEAPPLPPPATK